MNIDSVQLKDLLKKNKYLVCVSRTKTGCNVNVPSAKLLKRPEIDITIDVKETKEDEYCISVSYADEGKDTISNKENLTTNLELIILCLVETGLNYAFDLVRFENIDGDEIDSVDFFASFV